MDGTALSAKKKLRGERTFSAHPAFFTSSLSPVKISCVRARREKETFLDSNVCRRKSWQSSHTEERAKKSSSSVQPGFFRMRARTRSKVSLSFVYFVPLEDEQSIAFHAQIVIRSQSESFYVERGERSPAG